MKKITLMIPCYNEEKSLPILYEDLTRVIKSINKDYNWEILFINDGTLLSTKNGQG